MTVRATTRRPASVLATAAMAAIALAYVFCMFLPKQESIAAARQKLDGKQQFVLETQLLVPHISEAEATRQKAEDYVGDWESRLPSTARLAAYYELISASAAESGVSIKKFEPQPVETMNLVCRLPVQIAVEGSFEQIVSLLHHLETLGAATHIDSLSLEPLASQVRLGNRSRRETGPDPTPQKSESPVLSGQLTMQVFADKSGFSD